MIWEEAEQIPIPLRKSQGDEGSPRIQVNNSLVQYMSFSNSSPYFQTANFCLPC